MQSKPIVITTTCLNNPDYFCRKYYKRQKILIHCFIMYWSKHITKHMSGASHKWLMKGKCKDRPEILSQKEENKNFGFYGVMADLQHELKV